MKIAVLVEGKTETAFRPHLLKFLAMKLEGSMPKIKFFSYDGRIPKGERLKRAVNNHIADGYDAVIALTDVYTGDNEFKDAADAKRRMKAWVGANDKFHPHVALHDFEAWLLPYWPRIQELAGNSKKPPGPDPEKVNHNSPPSRHLKDLFENGKRKGRFSYNKPRDAKRILENQDLSIAANSCKELKSFLNKILSLSGLEAQNLL